MIHEVQIMVVIVDYNMGNLGSISNMLKKIDVDGVISSDPDTIYQADKLILPGVGSFDEGMRSLSNSQLLPVIEKKVFGELTPILGICLGMQLFANKSEEGTLSGLGWIDSEVRRFSFQDSNLKVPHMGWNWVKELKCDPLLNDMPDPSKFYFVHSYYFSCNETSDGLLSTHYGHDFVSGVKKNNIIGVQFHPEKSHKYGMKLLENFASL